MVPHTSDTLTSYPGCAISGTLIKGFEPQLAKESLTTFLDKFGDEVRRTASRGARRRGQLALARLSCLRPLPTP